jgi:Rrf2 family cysteine metabolism transcriptional repressor
MRLSAKAQYACIAMLELGQNYPDPHLVQVKTIADTHGISQRFLVQILLQLKVNGLVRSIRGAAGGYQIARRPDTISLADIINAIEQPAPAAPPALAALTPSPAVQAVGSVLQELEAKEKKALREISLADMLRRTEAGEMPTYQI